MQKSRGMSELRFVTIAKESFMSLKLDLMEHSNINKPLVTPLDIEQKKSLYNYLEKKHNLPKSRITDSKVLMGGVSNRTVWVKQADGTTWVLKQALTKLRVEEDWFSHPKRILMEAKGMEYLNKLGPIGSIPKLIFLDKQQYVLAMEAVPMPHQNFKTYLLQGNINKDYFRQFGDLLGTIQANAHERSVELAALFGEYSFFETLRLEPYYEFTAQKYMKAKSFLLDLVQKCRNHRYTLVHGDYSPKNILIYQNKLVLLDHEVVHFGDGTFDIGFALTHFLSKANHLHKRRRQLVEGAQIFWSAYQKRYQFFWSEELEDRAIAHTIACLLARVHGRSPLEYLTVEERKVQTEIATYFIKNRPITIKQLIDSFYRKLAHD